MLTVATAVSSRSRRSPSRLRPGSAGPAPATGQEAAFTIRFTDGTDPGAVFLGPAYVIEVEVYPPARVGASPEPLGTTSSVR